MVPSALHATKVLHEVAVRSVNATAGTSSSARAEARTMSISLQARADCECALRQTAQSSPRWIPLSRHSGFSGRGGRFRPRPSVNSRVTRLRAASRTQGGPCFVGGRARCGSRRRERSGRPRCSPRSASVTAQSEVRRWRRRSVRKLRGGGQIVRRNPGIHARTRTLPGTSESPRAAGPGRSEARWC
jgi:hypothetical protein